MIGLDASDAVMISAKTGLGIDDVLEAIVHRLPPPKGDRDATLKALWSTAGTTSISGGGAGTHRRWRDREGPAHPHDGHQHGYARRARRLLHPKTDTVRTNSAPARSVLLPRRSRRSPTRGWQHRHGRPQPGDRDALPGFEPAIPVVFCGLFPVDANDFESRAAMGELRLDRASFSFEMETSAALGSASAAAFFGSVHLEIVQERLPANSISI